MFSTLRKIAFLIRLSILDKVDALSPWFSSSFMWIRSGNIEVVQGLPNYLILLSIELAIRINIFSFFKWANPSIFEIRLPLKLSSIKFG